MNKNKRIKEKPYKILRKRRLFFFKSNLEQMEIAYNINRAKKSYQEVVIVKEKDSSHKHRCLGIRKVI